MFIPYRAGVPKLFLDQAPITGWILLVGQTNIKQNILRILKAIRVEFSQHLHSHDFSSENINILPCIYLCINEIWHPLTCIQYDEINSF
jgi:hypothetical protein